jgi:hypothetical protein
MMPSRASIAGELCSWLSRVGNAAVNEELSGERARVLVRLNRNALRDERTRLLVAYIRRVTDERQVSCAMTRYTVEHERRLAEFNREWIARVRGAASDTSS